MAEKIKGDSGASESLVFWGDSPKPSRHRKNGNFRCRWREFYLDVDQTDADVGPNNNKLEDKIRQKKEKYGYGDKIEAFVSPVFTLEYCLAESGIKNLFIKSIIKAGMEMGKKADDWKSDLDSKDSLGIYNDYIKEGKRVSKSIIGQCLADIIDQEELPKDIEDDDYIRYLFDAIKHVTSLSFRFIKKKR